MGTEADTVPPEPLRPFGEGGSGTGKGSRAPGRSSGMESGTGVMRSWVLWLMWRRWLMWRGRRLPWRGRSDSSRMHSAPSNPSQAVTWRQISGMRTRSLTSLMRFPSQTGRLRGGMEATASIKIRQRPPIPCLRTWLRGSGSRRPTGP